MKLSTSALILLLSLAGTHAKAHEDHKAPGSLNAIHGGIPKSGKLFNMEMLANDKKVQLYPIAHEGDKVDLTKIKLSGTAKSPKGKAQQLKFTFQDKSFDTEVDFQGAHRLNLEINADYEGKSDTFKFLVEK